jgi:ribosomal protein S18 acetylase RimI-like enzyme
VVAVSNPRNTDYFERRLKSQIHEYLREASRPFREIVQVGPFCATFTSGDDLPYINYAIPDDGAEPTPDEVSAFISACDARSRKPRLEYIPDLAPAVEPALLAAGFTEECRTPLMTCLPGDAPTLSVPAGFEFVFPQSDEELLGFAAALHEAFGQPPPGPDEVTRARTFIEKGGLSVLAREISTGETAGGGSNTVPVAGVTEVAGIGVREQFRRRGLGQAITTFLAREAFAQGISLAFLSAASENEARIYARAGFKTVGEVLHISR